MRARVLTTIRAAMRQSRCRRSMNNQRRNERSCEMGGLSTLLIGEIGLVSIHAQELGQFTRIPYKFRCPTETQQQCQQDCQSDGHLAAVHIPAPVECLPAAGPTKCCQDGK